MISWAVGNDFQGRTFVADRSQGKLPLQTAYRLVSGLAALVYYSGYSVNSVTAALNPQALNK